VVGGREVRPLSEADQARTAHHRMASRRHPAPYRKRGAPVMTPRNRAEQFFTIAEIAERMYVAPRTVSRWIRDKKLRSHKPGRIVRISESDFVDFLNRHRDD
jgi:excisionase family DNA binding protein